MKINKKGYIYIIENKINSKKYVGKTEKQVEIRFKEHIRTANKKGPKYFVLHKAITKYGENNFNLKSFTFPVEKLNEKEKQFIKDLKTKVPYGYNMTDGGDGASFPGKKNGMYGKKLSKEHKRSLMNFLVGHKCSEDTKKKMSLNNGMLNKKHNKSSKLKMRKNSPINKKVICIETNKIYSSAREAYRQTKISNVCIGLACRGIYKTAGKLHWSFYE
jgi:group I intron endonuclease